MFRCFDFEAASKEGEAQLREKNDQIARKFIYEITQKDLDNIRDYALSSKNTRYAAYAIPAHTMTHGIYALRAFSPKSCASHARHLGYTVEQTGDVGIRT